MNSEKTVQMTTFLAGLFAICSGLAIGNLYWAQPLLVQITNGFGLSAASGGLLVTATQIGYALGILFLVPLGDFVRRKRLISNCIGRLCLISFFHHIVSIIIQHGDCNSFRSDYFASCR